MKNMIQRFLSPAKNQLVAQFGTAQLVVNTDGRLELRGGSTNERAEAMEWVSLFMHEAVPKLVTH